MRRPLLLALPIPGLGLGLAGALARRLLRLDPFAGALALCARLS